MTEAVKRPYDNSRRQAQARATRLKVIEAAKRLFTDCGYPATTIEAVADAADVPLPTVYRLFGSKRALLTSWTSPSAVTTSRSRSATGPPSAPHGTKPTQRRW